MQNQYIPGVPDFIIFFLRAAGFGKSYYSYTKYKEHFHFAAMFGLSVPLIIAGSVILAFSKSTVIEKVVGLRMS